MTLSVYNQSTAITNQSATAAALTAQALPLLAILRKGGPKRERTKNGKTYMIHGEDLQHFRVDFRPGYEYLADTFTDLYGPEPDSITGVRLIGEQPFERFFELWNRNNTLASRHDGQQYIKRWTPDGYNFEPAPLDADAAKCTPVGRLHFWLPELAARTMEVGQFIALTTSINDCNRLAAYISTMAAAGIPVYDLDWELYRYPRDFTVPMNGKPSKITKHMVGIRVMRDSAQHLLAAQAGDHETDVITGEIMIEEDEPEALTRAAAARIKEHALGLGATMDDILAILQIEKWSDWTGGEDAAIAAIDAWALSTEGGK